MATANAAPKNAIVTGGASGLGLEIAAALSARGYRTIVFDTNKERLAELPANIVSYAIDVTLEAEVTRGVNDIRERFGPVDVLVNNAGTIFSCPVVNLMERERRRHDFQAFRRNIEINLNAVFLVTSVVAESMVLSRTQGVIVNISSISARGNGGQSAYSAAKAGVEALTRVWSKELGGFGIRAVAVAPGFMDTASTRAALTDQKLSDTRKKTPLGRLGSPSNVVAGVLFAIDCEFLTGTIIDINGGIVL